AVGRESARTGGPRRGRFSTTNGLPIRCSQTCAAMRASRSVEPAGVNGTTTVTILDGQSCADAGMIVANKARKGHSSHRGVMGIPPVDLASGDKHAPVKPAAARRSGGAPPSAGPPRARGLEREGVSRSARICTGREYANVRVPTRHHRTVAACAYNVNGVTEGSQLGAGVLGDT